MIARAAGQDLAPRMQEWSCSVSVYLMAILVALIWAAASPILGSKDHVCGTPSLALSDPSSFGRFDRKTTFGVESRNLREFQSVMCIGSGSLSEPRLMVGRYLFGSHGFSRIKVEGDEG